jgi:hypothetical protein
MLGQEAPLGRVLVAVSRNLTSTPMHVLSGEPDLLVLKRNHTASRFFLKKKLALFKIKFTD